MKMLKIQRLMALLLLSAIFSAIGCDTGRYPVTGFVKYPDGAPLEAGTVIAEGLSDGKLVSVQGNIEPDGSFKLGSMTPGDGAPPGNYKAVIMPVPLSDAELGAGKTAPIEGKYSRYESSGLAFEVKKGENKLDFQVTRPGKK